ncbi:MAG: class II aldolase/adducin family protein, partial [Desulfobacterales bacterium]|nr:class II aldolase/adducin family protein [Desulfobacterales bacterium]
VRLPDPFVLSFPLSNPAESLTENSWAPGFPLDTSSFTFYSPSNSSFVSLQKSPKVVKPMDHNKEAFITACRILENEGLATAFFSLSCRIDSRRILINSNHGHTLLTEESIQLRSLDDTPESGAAHHAIYNARKDVNAVVHAHPPYSIALGTVMDEFLPIHHYGTIFHGNIRVFESIGQINSEEGAQQLVECLGNGRALLQRGHGTLVVGNSLVEAVLATIYLEESARILYIAQNMGKPRPLPKNLSEQIGCQVFKDRSNRKAWDFYKARLQKVCRHIVSE